MLYAVGPRSAIGCKVRVRTLAAWILLATFCVSSEASASWACKDDKLVEVVARSDLDGSKWAITTESGALLNVLSSDHVVLGDWHTGDPLKVCIDTRFPPKYEAYNVKNLRLNTVAETTAIAGRIHGSRSSTTEQQ